jgi:hypothetical protein
VIGCWLSLYNVGCIFLNMGNISPLLIKPFFLLDESLIEGRVCSCWDIFPLLDNHYTCGSNMRFCYRKSKLLVELL